MKCKVLNGVEMSRMGRFDVERNDDRLSVYVSLDDGTTLRVNIEHDGTTHSERATGSNYNDAQTKDDDRQTIEIEFGAPRHAEKVPWNATE